MPLQANITSEQSFHVGVTGPADITTLHVVSGIANGQLSAFAPSGGFVVQQATFAAKVGPQLVSAQFRKAIASAAITSLNFSGDGTVVRWEVTDVDADLDDETSRIELTFDLRVSVQAGAASGQAVVASVGFQVLVLTA